MGWPDPSWLLLSPDKAKEKQLPTGLSTLLLSHYFSSHLWSSVWKVLGSSLAGLETDKSSVDQRRPQKNDWEREHGLGGLMSHLLVERAFILTPAGTQYQNRILHLLFASVLPSTWWVWHNDARRKENMHWTQYVA